MENDFDEVEEIIVVEDRLVGEGQPEPIVYYRNINNGMYVVPWGKLYYQNSI